jgi:hypothetical protein
MCRRFLTEDLLIQVHIFSMPLPLLISSGYHKHLTCVHTSEMGSSTINKVRRSQYTTLKSNNIIFCLIIDNFQTISQQ